MVVPVWKETAPQAQAGHSTLIFHRNQDGDFSQQAVQLTAEGLGSNHG